MADIKFPAIKDGEGVWLSLSEMADLLGTTAPASTPEPETTVLPWERMASNPSLVVEHTEIPPGQRYAYVKLAASHPPEATCFVGYGVRNVSGGGINTGDGSNQRKYYPAHLTVWRPGDDAEHWVTIDLQAARSVGNAIELILKPKGFNSDSGVIRRIRVVEGAVNELPAQMPQHREPYRLEVTGTPAADLDIGGMKWSDSGYDAAGKPCWRARLAHGYTQHGNGEMGAYLNTDKFPDAAVKPQSVEIIDGKPVLRLHTRRLDAPVFTDATSAYHFQASMIQGQRLEEWCARRGVYRAQLQTPDRHGAWSAFWAIGRSENGTWPPEIDFFEHFNGSWGASWDMSGRSTSSAQHVGVHNSDSRKRVNGLTMDLVALGFADLNLYSGVHDYACVIEDDYITHFIDGIETLQHRNMTDHQDGRTDWQWFPMLNVAVKPSSVNDPYDQGSGDMLVHGLQRYAAGSGYAMKPLTAPKPWPPQL